MSDDFIDEVLREQPVKNESRAKKRMTVYIDFELWRQMEPKLKGKFSALLEAAVRETANRSKKKQGVIK